MKYSFALILILISVNLFAQDSSKALLPADVMKLVHPSSNTLSEIKRMNSFDSTFENALVKYDNIHGNTVGFSYDFSSYYSYLRKIILGKKNLFLRQYAVMQIPVISLEGCKYFRNDNLLRRKCLQLLSPKDIIWKVFSDSGLSPILFFGNAYSNLALKNSIWTDEQNKRRLDFLFNSAFEYRYKIYKENPYKIVKADALVEILDLATAYERYEKADYYYRILKSRYSNLKSDIIKNALIEYDPAGRLRTGKTIPKFSFALIGSNKKISPQTLSSKFYLLQFWATWCSPCLAEMPFTRKIYDQLKGNNFSIISVSLDDSLSSLTSYWKKYGSMPWYNVILDNGYNNKIVKYFGITSIPVIVLVGPKGKILANIGRESENQWLETIKGYLTHQ